MENLLKGRELRYAAHSQTHPCQDHTICVSMALSCSPYQKGAFDWNLITHDQRLSGRSSANVRKQLQPVDDLLMKKQAAADSAIDMTS